MTTTSPNAAGIRFPLAGYPSISRFALDLSSGTGAAADLVAPSQGPVRAGGERAALAAGLVRSNAAWGNDVRAQVEAWAGGGARAVIAGQQVGAGGGPLYTLSKVASVVALARRLTREGTPAVPFFWLATEDHDLAEVSTLLLQRDGLLERIAAPPGAASRCPVGPLTLPEEIRAALEQRFGPARWLRRGITFGDSFAELLVDAVGSGTIVLVDSLLPELRRAGAPLFERLARRMDEAEDRITSRSREMEAAGYRPPVERGKEGRYSLLYRLDERMERVAILPGEALPAPERISTGVLARPLLQDEVFAPAAFVGGPAEVAYYAQLRPLHDMLEIGTPRVMLRGHVLVAPSKRLRVLEDYDIAVTEMFEPLEQVLARRPSAGLDALAREREAAEGELDRAAARIRELALSADPALERSMSRSTRRMRFHLDRMSERASRAIIRRDGERWAALTRLQQTLAPEGQPQDRVAGWIGWWQTWGTALFESLVEAGEPGQPVVRVAGL